MPSAILLMLLVKLKQVLFHSLNRNIHIRSDVLLRACPKNDRFAKKISLGSTAILLLLFLWNNIDVSALIALRALETAHARCKSSSKLGFCSLTRSFHLSVFSFQFSPYLIGMSYIRLYVPPKQVLWFVPYPGMYHILEFSACFSVILNL